MWVPSLSGLSEAAKSWLMIAAIATAAFGAGAGFMGWMDVPGKVQANARGISTNASALRLLAENDASLAEQLAVTRCAVEDLSNYECDRLREDYRARLNQIGGGP